MKDLSGLTWSLLGPLSLSPPWVSSNPFPGPKDSGTPQAPMGQLNTHQLLDTYIPKALEPHQCQMPPPSLSLAIAVHSGDQANPRRADPALLPD